jgi:proline iminopeptidase
MHAAKAWSVWEGRTATLRPDPKTVDFFADPHVAMSLARIEAHFFMHHAFLTPNQILNDASKLHGIPGVIVHGRYDLICPLENAWLLHKAWPDSQLNIIRDAGHAAYEAGITDALIHATREFGARFSKNR